MTALPQPNVQLFRPPVKRPKKILVVDVGGSKVKVLATGQAEIRKAPSGPELTAAKMVETAKELAGDWQYEAVSIGFPGVVDAYGPTVEPGNLGGGWVGFDFTAAFGKPVRLVNDAAMQALGSYEGGRMLFLGLGTGLGSSFVSEKIIIPLELGCLPYKGNKTMACYLGKKGREKLGHKEWQAAVFDIVALLKAAFAADYVMLGGGNAEKLDAIPPGARLGGNENAFLGGFRLWNLALPKVKHRHAPIFRRRVPKRAEWRVV